METTSSTITVIVNEQPIAMNNFVQETIKNVVLALITSLKLTEQPVNIKININLEE